MIRWLLLPLSILRIVPLMSPVPAHFGAIYLGESLSTDLNFSPAYFSLSRCVSRACPPFLSLSISRVSFGLALLSLLYLSFSLPLASPAALLLSFHLFFSPFLSFSSSSSSVQLYSPPLYPSISSFARTRPRGISRPRSHVFSQRN